LNQETPAERLGGSVERVTFHSEESGFCVLQVKVRGQRDLVTVVGTAARVSPGEYIETKGSWVTNRTHGLQFKAQHLKSMRFINPPLALTHQLPYFISIHIEGQ
jgi:exodeoxyribonuclease V alpha subunit